MLIRRAKDCPEIVANDGCRLRELLHPDKDGSRISYSLALAWVEPGKATFPHKLTGETEVYWIIEGSGRMHIGAEAEEVRPGDAVVIPRGSEQWIECTGREPLHYAAIVSPPWRPDHDVRVRS
ncbi:MAG: cupin domain-containing protein [Planctomycetes bacterium]|nr:cupin domain-containing protein [Planctomycetota bacterium]